MSSRVTPSSVADRRVDVAGHGDVDDQQGPAGAAAHDVARRRSTCSSAADAPVEVRSTSASASAVGQRRAGAPPGRRPGRPAPRPGPRCGWPARARPRRRGPARAPSPRPSRRRRARGRARPSSPSRRSDGHRHGRLRHRGGVPGDRRCRCGPACRPRPRGGTGG